VGQQQGECVEASRHVVVWSSWYRNLKEWSVVGIHHHEMRRSVPCAQLQADGPAPINILSFAAAAEHLFSLRGVAGGHGPQTSRQLQAGDFSVGRLTS